MTADPSVNHPAASAVAVTPHDTNPLTNISRGLYIGTAGNLAVVMQDGTEVNFASVPAGAVLPIRVQKVKATGTTAGNIVALS